MRKLIYSMQVSLDGFIAGPDGEIAVPAPDEELHRFHNEQTRELGGHLLGRRLHEVMAYWDTAAETNPSASDYELEFAQLWKDLPKVVFSRTLDSVAPNYVLVRDNALEEAAKLKEQPGNDLAVGGADLASTLLELIDEYRLFITPVVVGGGTPYFPEQGERLDLELVETRAFSGQTVYLRYRVR
jgi:dihydrofolate reductase